MIQFKDVIPQQEPLENSNFSTGIIAYYKDGNKIKVFMIKAHPFVHGIDRNGQEIRGNKGGWSFPKGYKRSDLSELENAQKEFKEETGITYNFPVDESAYIKLKRYSVGGGRKFQYFMFEIPPQDISQFKFVVPRPEDTHRFMQDFFHPVTGTQIPVPETDDAQFKDLEFIKNSTEVFNNIKILYDIIKTTVL